VISWGKSIEDAISTAENALKEIIVAIELND